MSQPFAKFEIVFSVAAALQLVFSFPVHGDDIKVTPGNDSSFVVTNSQGDTTKFEVDDNGVYTPGLGGPAAGDPVCSQQGNGGLLVTCAGTDIQMIQNCVDIASETWFPTQSKSVSADCAADSPIGGGCSITNLSSWTYTKAVQTKDNPSSSTWLCEWVMPPIADYGGVTVAGTTQICAWASCLSSPD